MLYFLAAFMLVYACLVVFERHSSYKLADNVVLIDSLDVGDLTSEAVHNYITRSERWNRTITAPFFNTTETVTEDGRLVNGSEIFLVNSVPGKDLVMVKRYDIKPFNQPVKLFAGLQEVGSAVFPDKGQNSSMFADFAYVIPGRYIKDTKTLITISYPSGNKGVTSMYYWFYTEGSPLVQKITLLLKIAVLSVVISLLLTYGKMLFNGRAFVLIPSIMLLILSALFSYYVMGAIPHASDSYTQLFQAKLLLQGRLYLDMPGDMAEFFSTLSVFYRDGHLSGKYPLGHPLVLALGEYLGNAYLVNPVLGALSVALLYYLGRETYGEVVGKYASLLMASTSFMIINAGEFMNHISMLFFVLLFSLFFFRSLKRNSMAYPLVAGLALGYGINIRPLTALAVFVPYAVYLLYLRFSGERVQSKKVTVFFAGLLFFLALFPLYNRMTTGSFTTSGYTYFDEDDVIGFNTKGHTLEKGITNTANNLYALKQYLFGESSILLFSIILLIFYYRSINRFDVLFFGLLSSFVIAYTSYHFGRLLFGPRYFFELTPFICLIIAKTFAALNSRTILNVLVIVALIYSLSFVYSGLSNYFVYMRVDGRLNRLLEAMEKDVDVKSIIFVDNSTYQSAVCRNRWNLQEDKIIYARSLTKEKIMNMSAEYFPDYRCSVLYLKDNFYRMVDCRDAPPQVYLWQDLRITPEPDR
jgi:hypothetical protein